MDYYGWKPYVPVAKRRANALREVKKLQKKGKKIEPVEIEGRKIAKTFWGEGWCTHLEQFSDFENRLPRGRTYVRNGSVCHLAIGKGKIEAIVSGSELYNIEISIKALAAKQWKHVRSQCAGQIGSMLELLQGQLSQQVMTVVTNRNNGLFPTPNEIDFSCDCPDWADMCKHVAAVLYGIGARLDRQPELLFLLRGVDHQDLIAAELDLQAATTGKGKGRRLAAQNIGDIFGLDIDLSPKPVKKPVRVKKTVSIKTTKSKPAKKKSAAKVGGKVGRTKTKKKALAKSQAQKSMRQKPFTPTAAAVRRLRKTFKMNLSQFARLLGITSATVIKWENGSGRLSLSSRTHDALERISSLSAEQAWSEVKISFASIEDIYK